LKAINIKKKIKRKKNQEINNDNNKGGDGDNDNVMKVIAGVDIIKGVIESEIFTDNTSEIHSFTGKEFKWEGFFSLNQIEEEIRLNI
jgi:hypothetical protein